MSPNMEHWLLFYFITTYKTSYRWFIALSAYTNCHADSSFDFTSRASGNRAFPATKNFLSHKNIFY